MRRSPHPGQSLPLLALMMVVIISVLGLSVDLGNAYGRQRNMQNAANAGAYGAMNAWLAKTDNIGSWTNQKIWNNAVEALRANGVQDTSKYRYRVDYVLKNGTVQKLGEWTGTATNPSPITGTPPTEVGRIEVTVWQDVDTFFARLAYRDTFTVNSDANVCFGAYSLAIMPVGVPAAFKPFDTETGAEPTPVPTATPRPGPGGPPTTPTPAPPAPRMDRIFEGWTDNNGNGKPDPGDTLFDELTDYSDARWSAFAPGGNPSLLKDHVIFLPFENQFHGGGGTHIPWLDWRQGGGVNLRDRLTWPGSLPDGYREAVRPRASEGADHDGIPEPGDWVAGDTGVVAGQADEIINWDYREVLLPIFNEDNGLNGSNISYHWYITGRFRAVGYFYANGADKRYGVQRPTGVDTNEKYIMLEYIGPAEEGTAQSCNP